MWSHVAASETSSLHQAIWTRLPLNISGLFFWYLSFQTLRYDKSGGISITVWDGLRSVWHVFWSCISDSQAAIDIIDISKIQPVPTSQRYQNDAVLKLLLAGLNPTSWARQLASLIPWFTFVFLTNQVNQRKFQSSPPQNPHTCPWNMAISRDLNGEKGPQNIGRNYNISNR